MKNYFDQWVDNIRACSSSTLSEPLEVEGIRDKHLGPRSEFAKIKVRVERASHFVVETDLLSERAALERLGYIDAAVNGMLDVLLCAGTAPLKNVAITFLSSKMHPIDSTPMAFRQAGRDAAHKIIEAQNAPR